MFITVFVTVFVTVIVTMSVFKFNVFREVSSLDDNQ